MTTVRAALAAGTRRLAEARIPEPARDARRLLAYALGIAPDRVTLAAGDLLQPAAAAAFEAALVRRLDRVPLAQITGTRQFWGRAFRVTPDVLDPRPETETLVALALAEPFSRVLDLGTGSGCLIVTLLTERPEAQGVGTDVSPEAVLVAGENAARHGVDDRLILPLSEWFDDIGGRYDLIVSNPPYIPSAEIAALAPEVRDHEPRPALDGGADGLDAYRAIAAGAAAHLAPGGRLLVEIGPDQGAAVAALFRAAGLEGVGFHPDLDGRDRVVLARAPASPVAAP